MNKTITYLSISCLFIVLAGCNVSELTEANPLKCEVPDVLKTEMLRVVNAARTQDQVCNGQLFDATGAVTWNDQLMDAAEEHSIDMATNDFFAHEGTDGTTVADRVTNVGYNWMTVGENLVAAVETSEDAVNEWLKSTTGHCENLMNPAYKEMGVACIENKDATYQAYWTQVLAESR